MRVLEEDTRRGGMEEDTHRANGEEDRGNPVSVEDTHTRKEEHMGNHM